MNVSDEFLLTQQICSSNYLDWLNNNGILNKLKSNIFPEKLFFEKNWSEKGMPIFMKIMEFLTAMGIVQSEGGAIHLNPSNIPQIQPMLKQKQQFPSSNPVSVFVRIALKKLDSLLMHDDEKFSLEKDLYLVEAAFVFPYFRDIIMTVKHLIKSTYKSMSPPRILLLGNFVEWFVAPLVQLIEFPDQITLIAPSTVARNNAIAFCELHSKTSIFSNKIITYSQLKDFEKAEFLLGLFALGFDLSPLDMKKLMSSLLKHEGYIIGNFPFHHNKSGLEPFFPMIENWRGDLSSDRFFTDPFIKTKSPRSNIVLGKLKGFQAT